MRDDEALLVVEIERLAGRGGSGGFPGIDIFGGRGREGEYKDIVKLGYCVEGMFWIGSGSGGRRARAAALLRALTRS